MSTDLESALRREFDAVRAPGSLTFSPETVVRTGRRTILRHRIIAAGSAAIAVALMATGASLLTRPDDGAAPQPATRTVTTGIVLGQTAHLWGGQSEVRFNLDPRAQSNVRFSVLGKNGQRHELGVSSTGKPGQPQLPSGSRQWWTGTRSPSVCSRAAGSTGSPSHSPRKPHTPLGPKSSWAPVSPCSTSTTRWHPMRGKPLSPQRSRASRGPGQTGSSTASRAPTG